MLPITQDCYVEVSYEKDEFKGGWYRAILEESPTKSEMLRVHYTTLLTEDGSTPLTEIVDQSLIRPVPPEDMSHGGAVFEEGSMVDAYHKDGWWSCLVLKRKEVDDTYLVYFDSPPDIIQFEKKQLRAHLDWTGSKWVRPENTEWIKSDFSSGSMVELRLYLAWRPAMIIKEDENEKRFIVKYLSDSGRESEIRAVGSRKVRPWQPLSSVGEYELLDHVEAFNGSEWRQGVVRGVVFEGRYMVSFGKEKVASAQFNCSDLRPLMEWKDGIWRLKRPKPKSRKETPSGGQRNKPVALETRAVQTKEPLFAQGSSNEMADDVLNAKEPDSPVTSRMAATENKTQEKRNHNCLGNESTRGKIPEDHNFKCYTLKRKRREDEHNSDLDDTVLSSDQTPTVVKNSAANVEENQSMVLPFAKKSPVWKTYETMEVFKRVPQSPHFSPLLETSEDFREGSALGMMATFSGLFEKLKDLETDVPKSQLDSLKVSFTKLEKRGFDVTRPLSRIDKLLALKDRQLNILEERKGFNEEMMVESSKMCKAEEEFSKTERKIVEVKHKILELQRQEAALKEHKQEAKEEKDAAYRNICQMESCTRVLGVELEDVEFDFETILSAPW
ncbi:hypothetical protein EUTSA_v10027025mg [Eutrema salsugineum]|uniref:Agenet domain-containing protein n=1 Tax=Eutrema salsugineum TaxID=72664 RepID=V4ML44_EUTSA|nr:hypothetical protein EUTSA_v10027025mg [Eutrema salsugineum]